MGKTYVLLALKNMDNLCHSWIFCWWKRCYTFVCLVFQVNHGARCGVHFSSDVPKPFPFLPTVIRVFFWTKRSVPFADSCHAFLCFFLTKHSLPFGDIGIEIMLYFASLPFGQVLYKCGSNNSHAGDLGNLKVISLHHFVVSLVFHHFLCEIFNVYHLSYVIDISSPSFCLWNFHCF